MTCVIEPPSETSSCSDHDPSPTKNSPRLLVDEGRYRVSPLPIIDPSLDDALREVISGEPCIHVRDGRILCGEAFTTSGGEEAMLFAAYVSLNGKWIRAGRCLMPVEALAAAIETGRIVVPAGDDE